MKTLREQAGQLLTIGFEGQECNPELKSLLHEIQPGGVIFFQRNIATEEQFQSLVRQIRELIGNSLPFLAIDQEGGQVDRFRDLIAPLPSAREAAQAGMAFELGDLAGRELAALGLNLDFAPMLDIGSGESRAILGTRTAGETPQEVIRFAVEFLKGLNGWNIFGCGKHFPGLGGGVKDSHLGMPRIEDPLALLWEEDLLPFRQLATQVAMMPMMMVAHAWYPQAEQVLAPGGRAALNPTPASLSPNIVTTLLRERIGYEGMVVCDDLEMGGVLEGRTIEEAAVSAVRAGCEVLLVCRHADNIKRAYAAILREAEQDTSFRAQVEQAAQRIALSKRQLINVQGRPEISFASLEALARNIRGLGEDIRLRLARQADTPDDEPAED